MDWPQLIPLDIRLSQTQQVTQALTVQATVPDLPPVYSTPNMILSMEIVCAELIAKSIRRRLHRHTVTSAFPSPSVTF
jgi:predicted thioesterase